MLFNPTERNVNPFQIPAGARTMKKLVLALAIHDKNVTMAKPAQVTFTIRTGLTSPSEKCRAAKTHRYNELGITTLSKQRFVIAVPSYTRFPSPIKVQVRGSRHLSLSTPGLHQGCDSPPHTSKQRPAPPASVRPDSGASPVRVRTSTRGITRDRPRCVVRPFPDPVSCCAEGRKKILPSEGTPKKPYPRPYCFLQLGPAKHVPNDSAWPRWLRRTIKT